MFIQSRVAKIYNVKNYRGDEAVIVIDGSVDVDDSTNVDSYGKIQWYVKVVM